MYMLTHTSGDKKRQQVQDKNKGKETPGCVTLETL